MPSVSFAIQIFEIFLRRKPKQKTRMIKSLINLTGCLQTQEHVLLAVFRVRETLNSQATRDEAGDKMTALTWIVMKAQRGSHQRESTQSVQLRPHLPAPSLNILQVSSKYLPANFSENWVEKYPTTPTSCSHNSRKNAKSPTTKEKVVKNMTGTSCSSCMPCGQWERPWQRERHRRHKAMMGIINLVASLRLSKKDPKVWILHFQGFFFSAVVIVSLFTGHLERTIYVQFPQIGLLKNAIRVQLRFQGSPHSFPATTHFFEWSLQCRILQG